MYNMKSRGPGYILSNRIGTPPFLGLRISTEAHDAVHRCSCSVSVIFEKSLTSGCHNFKNISSLFLFKRILTWWYHRKIQKNEEKLQKLKEKRTKILNEVMETETYKVAKEILEKYAPEQLIRSSSGVPTFCSRSYARFY